MDGISPADEEAIGETIKENQKTLIKNIKDEIPNHTERINEIINDPDENEIEAFLNDIEADIVKFLSLLLTLKRFAPSTNAKDDIQMTTDLALSIDKIVTFLSVVKANVTHKDIQRIHGGDN